MRPASEPHLLCIEEAVSCGAGLRAAQHHTTQPPQYIFKRSRPLGRQSSLKKESLREITHPHLLHNTLMPLNLFTKKNTQLIELPHATRETIKHP